MLYLKISDHTFGSEPFTNITSFLGQYSWQKCFLRSFFPFLMYPFLGFIGIGSKSHIFKFSTHVLQRKINLFSTWRTSFAITLCPKYILQYKAHKLQKGMDFLILYWEEKDKLTFFKEIKIFEGLIYKFRYLE